MLSDYRRWLESELSLLGNANDNAYSLGEANMAKRAMERLDAEIGDHLIVPMTRAEANAVLTEIEMRAERERGLSPALERFTHTLHATLTAAGSTSGGSAPQTTA